MVKIINSDKVGLRKICTATGASDSTMIRSVLINRFGHHLLKIHCALNIEH